MTFETTRDGTKLLFHLQHVYTRPRSANLRCNLVYTTWCSKPKILRCDCTGLPGSQSDSCGLLQLSSLLVGLSLKYGCAQMVNRNHLQIHYKAMMISSWGSRQHYSYDAVIPIVVKVSWWLLRLNTRSQRDKGHKSIGQQQKIQGEEWECNNQSRTAKWQLHKGG